MNTRLARYNIQKTVLELTREPGDQLISFSSLFQLNDSPRKEWSMWQSSTVCLDNIHIHGLILHYKLQTLADWLAVIWGHVILLKSKRIHKPKKSHNGMSVKHVFAFSKQNYFKLKYRRNGCSIADFLRVSRPIPSHGLLFCQKYNDIKPNNGEWLIGATAREFQYQLPYSQFLS